MGSFPRTAGVLCHVTSLPGQWGIGDLGSVAWRFADWLETAGQGLWQVLPLGPPGFGESPYQSYSAFAGNPLLVGLDQLAEAGWLDSHQLDAAPAFNRAEVDFEHVRPFREQCLAEAYQTFRMQASPGQHAEFDAFRRQQAWWLEDYTLFAALKKAYGGEPWTNWSSDLVRRTPAALADRQRELAADIEQETFIQFQFHSQWQRLKARCNSRGIRLMGDVPIFVAHDSADVWARQELFFLDERGQPTKVAGVPPDYFSGTGQLWGNPLYRWERMAQDDFAWWQRRMRHALAQFDLVRVDHFRGFEAFWEIPAGASTAAAGRWVQGPAAHFFRKVREALGALPLVAEDLGVITPAVEALRDEFGFPGMRILQFAFGDDPKGPDYQPHNYPRHCFVYTGTHDNDTTRGWFDSRAGQGTTRTAEQIAREQAFALSYLGTDGAEIHWDMIRLALASVADTAVVPLQDVLGLGADARMNLPGTSQGNWRWRFADDMLLPEQTRRLRELTAIYDRIP
jgi:4-alpha-glucanotransferase